MTNALEGGLAGATTLTLLHEAIDKIDPKAPKTRLLHNSRLLKKIKKQSNKKGRIPIKFYIRLATELLASAGYFGLSGLGKKKNAVLRGGLLGAAAGLGVAFLNSQDEEDKNQENRNATRDKILTIALYTAGGLIAGAAIKRFNKKKKK